MMDLHCHLDLYKDPISIAKEIVRRKVFVLSVTTTPSAYQRTSMLSTDKEFICTGIGLHPQLVHQRIREVTQMNKWIESTDFVGEIGLDGGSEYSSSWNDQVKVFKYALKLSSQKGGRILSIHSRRAAKPVLNYLEKESASNTAILHWFSGTHREVKRASGIGCWFSVNPSMLAGQKGKELLKLMPRDRILLETDGPFTSLKGVPYKPWDSEIYCIPIIAKEWAVTEDVVTSCLKNNLNNLLRRRHIY